jgi:hypothetical protein
VKHECTLIEFAGIPYSWKTSTMNELQRNLRSHGIIAQAVQEFRGDAEFYSRRKLTSDVNLLRALNFMQEFVQLARDMRTEVVLVDRGLFDSRCWVKWMEGTTDVPKQYQSVIESLVDSVQVFTNRYRIVWMDRNPIEALRSYGEHRGRIVNFANLSSLRDVYEREFGDPTFPASFHKVESDSSNAQQVAAQLASQLKLI